MHVGLSFGGGVGLAFQTIENFHYLSISDSQIESQIFQDEMAPPPPQNSYIHVQYVMHVSVVSFFIHNSNNFLASLLVISSRLVCMCLR